MQISPTAALLNAISSAPAQAGAATTGVNAPSNPQAAEQPPALAAAAKALEARTQAAQAPAPAPSAPAAEGQAPKNLPRGSIINIVV